MKTIAPVLGLDPHLNQNKGMGVQKKISQNLKKYIIIDSYILGRAKHVVMAFKLL